MVEGGKGKKTKKGKKLTSLRSLPPLAPADTFDIVPLSSLSTQDVLQAAIRLSIAGADFGDTKFYVFSRRTTSGSVKTPRAVIGNSLALRRASAHFEHLLSGGFAESVSSRMDASSYINEQMSVDMYGYESDSDLEDEDEEDEDNIGNIRETVSSGQPQEVPDNLPVVEGSAVREDATKGSTSQDVKSSEILVESTGSTVRDALIPKELGQAHRTVFVKDMAFKTWQAFMFYTYLGKVEFAPLRSQAGTTRKEKGHWQADLYKPPQCSPKSMYRLADKYDLKDLKELAKNDIKQKLTEDNILVELFSDFTSSYSEILELEIQFIRDNSGVRTKLLASIPQWLESVAAGNLPGSADVLISLFKNLVGTADSKCPYNCQAGVTRNCNSCRRNF
ncbi:hypothetical protein B0H21DRAFT_757574 [Amylocystis lapponica]|nr:hypothetical protein B0H21DRAFT_757574 [Amylocystis lapponica]